MIAKHEVKSINLALQGGGAHGAFTWGVLETLLEESRLYIDSISGTSAGAMNAAMFKTGWLDNGNQGAIDQLGRFWGEIRKKAEFNVSPFRRWLTDILPDEQAARTAQRIYASPTWLLSDALQRNFSPYEWNPLNIHPLRDLLEDMTDWSAVCRDCCPHIFVSATNVRSGKIKVFEDEALSIDVLLASACLPTLFQAIEVDGEHYWDGGYMGNPALFPLFGSDSSDIVIVHINPIERDEVPETAPAILNRINEISFNSSLLRELRAIDFVHRLIESGRLTAGEMKEVLIHSIRDDKTMAELNVGSKTAPEPVLIDHLRAEGQRSAERFLRDNWTKINAESSVNLREMFA